MPIESPAQEPLVSPMLVVIAAACVAVQSFTLGDLAGLGGAQFAAFDPAFFFVAGGVNAIAGVPFGLLLPTLKAGNMAKQWGVPRQTYLLSRPALRAICSVTSGGAVGTIVALPFVELMLSPLVLAISVFAICLLFSTSSRFRRHRCTEWVMPPPGYELVRPLIRATRPDA